jgi:hypothetical protein
MKNKGIQVIDNSNEGRILDLKINPIRDASGRITSGLVIGETLEQNIAFILTGHQGDFKFNPELGVGLGDLLLGSDFPEYRHRIRSHFGIDGLKIKELILFENKPFKVDASYEQ